jgi:hypothetical protein
MNPIKKEILTPLITPKDVMIGDGIELETGGIAPVGYVLF